MGAALCHETTVLDGIAGTWPPDDTGSSGLAVAKALVARGWAGNYLHAFTLDDVLHALSYQGPCLLGMNWRTLMDHPAVTTGRDRYAGPSRVGHEPLLTEVPVHRHRDGTLDEARSLVWIDNTAGPPAGATMAAPASPSPRSDTSSPIRATSPSPSRPSPAERARVDPSGVRAHFPGARAPGGFRHLPPQRRESQTWRSRDWQCETPRMAAPAGWYPDSVPGRQRYWDGRAWAITTRPVPDVPPAADASQRPCPYCTTPMPTMASRCTACSGQLRFCKRCKAQMGTHSKQKFVGLARGGSKEQQRCMGCNAVLDGPRF